MFTLPPGHRQSFLGDDCLEGYLAGIFGRSKSRYSNQSAVTRFTICKIGIKTGSDEESWATISSLCWCCVYCVQHKSTRAYFISIHVAIGDSSRGPRASHEPRICLALIWIDRPNFRWVTSQPRAIDTTWSFVGSCLGLKMASSSTQNRTLTECNTGPRSIRKSSGRDFVCDKTMLTGDFLTVSLPVEAN